MSKETIVETKYTQGLISSINEILQRGTETTNNKTTDGSYSFSKGKLLERTSDITTTVIRKKIEQPKEKTLKSTKHVTTNVHREKAKAKGRRPIGRCPICGLPLNICPFWS